MMNKISKREKILILILVLTLVVYGYYEFIYTKQITTIKEYESAIEVIDADIEKAKAGKDLIQRNNEKIAEEKKRINTIQADYFPIMEQENFLILLGSIIDDLDLDIKDIPLPEYSFESINISGIKSDGLEDLSEKSTLEILKDTYNNELDTMKQSEDSESDENDESEDSDTDEGTSSEDISEENTEVTVKKISINLTFQGTYEKLRETVRYFNDFRRKVVISSLNFTPVEQDLFDVSMDLDFYFIPALIEMEINNEFIEWIEDSEKGKYNPFEVGSTIITSDEMEEIMAHDFTINLSPIASDFSTTVVSKVDDLDQIGTLHDDNEDIVDLSMELYMDGEKYYYRYKTSSTSVPSNFDEGIEFSTDKNIIKVKIYSRERVSAEDLSGINLNVINNMDNIKVIVEVIGDDRERPRVNKVEKEGNVQVLR